MTLVFAARHRLGSFSLDASFEAGPGITALFGPSGAGKTTIVNLLAGLIRPEDAHIVLNGRVLTDTEKRIFVPSHRRQLGYVFQDSRLFPHFSVRNNLLFGRWFAPKAERWASFDQVIEVLGIGHLLERRPATLSGGERQRIAIGRALLSSPKMLLFDEPLASLDRQRKAEILPFIERLRGELSIPAIYVTHAVEEVVRLADTVVLISGGRAVGTGSPADMLGGAATLPAVGRFEASSLFTCYVRVERTAHGMTILDHPSGEIHVPHMSAPPGSRVRLRIRARDVALALSDPGAGMSIRNRLNVQVLDIQPTVPPYVEVKLAAGTDSLWARITGEAAAELKLTPGQHLIALIKSIALEN